MPQRPSRAATVRWLSRYRSELEGASRALFAFSQRSAAEEDNTEQKVTYVSCRGLPRETARIVHLLISILTRFFVYRITDVGSNLIVGH